MPGRLPRAAWSVGVALLLPVVAALASGQGGPAPALRDDFEGPRPSWRREVTDATVQLQAHDRSERAAHGGRTSERLRFTAGPGSTLYFSYPLPPAPLTRDLKAQIYVRANQEGLRLFGRVVLPGDTDPDTGQPSFVTVPGSVYETADRWQRLELAELPAAVEQQVRVLRARTRRPVPLEGAYLERLVLNVYGGPGDAEVFLDDLSVSPVPAATPPPPVAAAEPVEPLGPERAAGPEDKPRLELRRNRLTRDGFPWVPTIISAPGADLQALRRYGFDVLATDLDDDLRAAREAAGLGFLLMPRVARADNDGRPRAPEAILADLRRYPLRQAVAFWDLGEGLGQDLDPGARAAELERVRAVISGLGDEQGDAAGASPVTGGVVGLLPQYALEPRLGLMGAHVDVWGSSLHPLSYYRFLAQRRDLTALSNPQGLFWTWIPAAAPAGARSAIWGTDVPPAWGSPRVQPEQIRMFTFAALAAGYRAVGFRADAELTRASGRARLIELALLNAEIDLFESILARGTDPIALLNTYPPNPVVEIHEFNPYLIKPPPVIPELGPHPTIRAAALETRDHRGTLLLVADYPAAGQWQPGQMAINDLKIRVNAPQSAQAYEVSLGGVAVLERERVPGGIQISLPDFGPTALILVTTDRALAGRLEEAIARIRPLAIELAIQQAELQVQWVTEIDGRLAADGHAVEGSGGLLGKAREGLKSARSALEREDYPLAWSEARRVGRPLRVVMVSHFLKALGDLVKATQRDENDKDILISPVSSPPLTAFNTLPQQYLWTSWIDQGRFGADLLDDGGSFEEADPEAYAEAGWSDQGYPVDGVAATIATVEEARGEGRRVLRLQAAPARAGGQDRLPPFQDRPVAAIRSPAVAVGARQLVRISVLVKMPRGVPEGAGGLIVRDSLGGAALQFQSSGPIPKWMRVILYRRVPADGELAVTLGLAASVGEAFFDDLRIDRIETGSSSSSSAPPVPSATPRRPSPALPAATLPRPGRRVSAAPGPAPAWTVR